MKNKIYFTRISTLRNGETIVKIIPNKGKPRVYEFPSDSSLYRLMNNRMVSDICPYREHGGLLLEIFPKY